MQSLQVLERATYVKLLEHANVAEKDASGGVEPAGEGSEDRDQPQGDGAASTHEISEALASSLSQENMRRFKPLEEAVDR